MRTEYIRYLLSIGKHRSISSAAEELYLGQTTLSSVVRRVEEEVGFSIFRRTNTGVTLTPEGEEALVIMKKIDSCFSRIEQIRSQPTLSHSVPFLVSPSLNYGFSLPLCLKMIAELPEENPEFRVCTGSEIVPRIIKNESNLGLTYLTDNALKKHAKAAVRYRIELEPLFRDELFLLVRADSPLAGTEEVSFDYLKGMDLAMLAHFNIGENALAFKEHLGSRHFYTTYPNIRLIKKAVLTQNVGAVLSGFSVFCDSSFPLEEFHAVRLLYPGGKNHQFQACLICRDRENLTPGEAMIKEMVRSQYKGLSISL